MVKAHPQTANFCPIPTFCVSSTTLHLKSDLQLVSRPEHLGQIPWALRSDSLGSAKNRQRRDLNSCALPFELHPHNHAKSTFGEDRTSRQQVDQNLAHTRPQTELLRLTIAGTAQRERRRALNLQVQGSNPAVWPPQEQESPTGPILGCYRGSYSEH